MDECGFLLRRDRACPIASDARSMLDEDPLQDLGLHDHDEPFHTLLCQGMVNHPTYSTEDGEPIAPHEVNLAENPRAQARGQAGGGWPDGEDVQVETKRR